MVTVERSNSGDSLSIGLGRSAAVLSYVRGDKEPPYHISVGGSELTGVISFSFGGELSEFPLRSAVPLSHAFVAMRHFCETGERSTDVEWEEA